MRGEKDKDLMIAFEALALVDHISIFKPVFFSWANWI